MNRVYTKTLSLWACLFPFFKKNKKKRSSEINDILEGVFLIVKKEVPLAIQPAVDRVHTTKTAFCLRSQLKKNTLAANYQQKTLTLYLYKGSSV